VGGPHPDQALLVPALESPEDQAASFALPKALLPWSLSHSGAHRAKHVVKALFWGQAVIASFNSHGNHLGKLRLRKLNGMPTLVQICVAELG
jgi:hypothetical protein